MTKKFKVYYYPMADDRNWNQEVTKILPYCGGRGIDIGSGGRSINKEILRLDINSEWEPDIVSGANEIPVKDAEFDFIVSQHSFEHLEDQVGALKEWLRILKPGGYINIIHPDVEHTKEQLPPEKNPKLKADPYYKHTFERTQEQFMKWIKSYQKLGFKIVENGVALGNWSFYVILRKDKEGVS